MCSSFGCSAVTRCYDRTDDNANAPINHATERSRVQRVVRNLLLDPMCEENSSVWEKSSTGTITRDQSTRFLFLVFGTLILLRLKSRMTIFMEEERLMIKVLDWLVCTELNCCSIKD